MVSKRVKSSRKPQTQTKARTVRKLSPEQPAARDEGPRLIPLGPAKDAGLGRIEHYLDLADQALGHGPAKFPATMAAQSAPAVAAPGVPSEAELSAEAELAPEPDFPAEAPSEPAEVPLLAATSIPPTSPPHPPKLQLPKPPSMPRPPRPPKLTRPLPPKAPRFPKPPKLALPRPPGRKSR